MVNETKQTATHARGIWRSLSVAILCVMALQMHPASAARLAFVAGNDRYEHVRPLKNARTDAKAMASALRDAGYTVELQLDRKRRDLLDALRAFKARVNGGDEVVLFFSGHGVQLGGTNYLLPVDVRSDSEDQVRDDALSLSRVLFDLRSQRPGFTLAIVDACRDNPFKGMGRDIGGRGLTGVAGATGQMVIYAAGEGQKALDRLSRTDPSPNGLFTRVFLKEMSKAGVPINEVLRNVREEVYTLAQGVKHEQVPAIYDQALGRFYFYPPGERQDDRARVHNERLRSEPSERPERVEDESGRLEAGQVFKDCPDCPEMVVIPAGSFEMGSSNDHLKSYNDFGKQVRQVRIGRMFALGKYEVTQIEWRLIMGSNPSHFSKCGGGCPVENVSWDEVQEFIRQLSQKTGEQYRLPSEAEWEYACRARGHHKYCGSNDSNSVAWYAENSGQGTHQVGMKSPNGFGLYDMSGNVFEWVQDCGASGEGMAPSDGSARERAECSWRVLRGGSWDEVQQHLRSEYNGRVEIPGRVVGFSIPYGFRLARDLR